MQTAGHRADERQDSAAQLAQAYIDGGVPGALACLAAISAREAGLPSLCGPLCGERCHDGEHVRGGAPSDGVQKQPLARG